MPMHADKINLISQHKLFRSTSLYEEFKSMPIGFGDLGAAGGIHHMILPIADLVNCIMFEPNTDALSTEHPDACDIKKINNNIFNELRVVNSAVSDTNGTAELKITANKVSSSFLDINEEFVERYKTYGFKVVSTCTAKTQTLDSIVNEKFKSSPNVFEIIKVDCQGMEKKILSGASEILSSRCLAILSEVSFTESYHNQATFTDIDSYLKSKGFILYGLYNRYVSEKHIDRKEYYTNEKLFEADALYFKDPLHEVNRNIEFNNRKKHLLILFALLFDYFEFAMDLINKFISNKTDRTNLVKLIEFLSTVKKNDLIKNTDELIKKCNDNPEKSFLYAQQYIDKNRGNSSIEFMNDI